MSIFTYPLQLLVQWVIFSTHTINSHIQKPPICLTSCITVRKINNSESFQDCVYVCLLCLSPHFFVYLMFSHDFANKVSSTDVFILHVSVWQHQIADVGKIQESVLFHFTCHCLKMNLEINNLALKKIQITIVSILPRSITDIE